MKSLLLAAAALVLTASQSQAQVVTYYSPVIAPAPVVVSPYVGRRVVYSPVVAAPPVATAVSPVATVIAPVAQPVVTTRYRPILGGTVSRVRYRYAPQVVVPLY